MDWLNGYIIKENDMVLGAVSVNPINEMDEIYLIKNPVIKYYQNYYYLYFYQF